MVEFTTRKNVIGRFLRMARAAAIKHSCRAGFPGGLVEALKNRGGSAPLRITAQPDLASKAQPTGEGTPDVSRPETSHNNANLAKILPTMSLSPECKRRRSSMVSKVGHELFLAASGHLTEQVRQFPSGMRSCTNARRVQPACKSSHCPRYFLVRASSHFCNEATMVSFLTQ